jgi:hypothetical protein
VDSLPTNNVRNVGGEAGLQQRHATLYGLRIIRRFLHDGVLLSPDRFESGAAKTAADLQKRTASDPSLNPVTGADLGAGEGAGTTTSRASY